MKQDGKGIASVLVVVAVIAVGMLSGAWEVQASEKGSAYAQQIQGSWSLVSQYVDQDGKKIEAFGSNPKGAMILTSDGRFMIILMKAELPKFAAKSRVKGTAEENQAVVQGSVAYFGTYFIASEKEHQVSLRIEGSTYPNWTGEEQKRIMTMNGDEMKMITPTAAIGGVSNIVWKRVK